MKAVFFDRDGTLNIDPGYINDPEKMRLYPAASDVIRRVKAMGYVLFVITNQSGINRGLIRPAQYRLVHERFISLFDPDTFDEILYCPHTPQHACSCRKPQKLLVDIINERYPIDLSQSYFVGDKGSDIRCGKAAGMQTIVISNKTDHSLGLQGEAGADFVIDTLEKLPDVLR